VSPGEIQSLKWSYIDTKANLIRLPEEVTKTRKGRLIPINHHVEAALKALPRAIHHDSVITYKGHQISRPGGLKRSFSTACKNVGLVCGRDAEGGVTFHDIRRTVKTNMVNAGVDKVSRDLILGHSLQGMDVHYIAPSEDDLKRAMDRYTGWLDEQIERGLEKAKRPASG
jgi:integrase